MKNKKRKRNIFFYILLFFNIITSLSLLLSYFSGFISPSILIFPAYFGLGYIVILSANLFITLIWLLIKPKIALYNLILILAGWNLIWGHFQINIFNPDIKTPNISFLNYNTHNFKLHHPDSLHTTNYRNDILNFINKGNFDIVCLQEFFSINNKDSLQNDSIFQILNYPDFFYSTYQKPKKRKGLDAMITFSRFPIINKGLLLNSYNETYALFTDIIIHKDTIRLFNIHLTSIKLGNVFDSIQEKSVFKIGKAFQLRAKEVDYLKKELLKSPFPVIICGDFNDTPSSYTYQQLICGLNDTYAASINSNIGNTYYWNKPPIRIDHIIINQRYKPIYYKVEQLKYSDHYPVIAKIIKK